MAEGGSLVNFIATQKSSGSSLMYSKSQVLEETTCTLNTSLRGPWVEVGRREKV